MPFKIELEKLANVVSVMLILQLVDSCHLCRNTLLLTFTYYFVVVAFIGKNDGKIVINIIPPPSPTIAAIVDVKNVTIPKNNSVISNSLLL